MRIRTNKLVVLGALGVSALGLIGLGASASFTDQVSATQTITTGGLCMKIASVDEHGIADGTVSADGKSITWKLLNSGSDVSQKHMVEVTNACSLPLTITDIHVKALGGGLDPSPLGDHVNLDFANFNNSVRGIENSNWICFCQLAPGQTLAVNGDPGIRFEFTGELNNVDQNQTINPTLTLVAGELGGGAPTGPATIKAG